LGPSAASAATLSLRNAAIAYDAAPGESNDLDIRRDGTAIVFTERAAAITDFPPFCTARAPGVVACDSTLPFFLPRVEALLADGNDRITVDLPWSTNVDAGEGNDSLALTISSPVTGGPGGDVIVEGTGGPGDDVLIAAGQLIARGGSGNDQLTAAAPDALTAGEAGDDTLTGSPGRDNLQGGEGRDAVQAGDGDDSILADSEFGGDDADTIDAGPGNDRVFAGGGDDTASGGPGNDLMSGEAGNDRLAGDDGDDRLDGGAGNDRATGGAGTDWVSGGDGKDRLSGGADNDSLLGGADDDTLTMGPGRDRANAGAGDDRIAARDGVAAPLECGAGEDAAAPDSRDRVHVDCETIEQRVACPRRWRQRCRVAGTLTGGRRNTVIGRGAVGVPSGKNRTLRVPVSSKGKDAVRRDRRLNVRLNVSVSAGERRRATSTRFSLRVAL
jgi:Ca2+-binding RTX toxin-like protein